MLSVCPIESDTAVLLYENFWSIAGVFWGLLGDLKYRVFCNVCKDGCLNVVSNNVTSKKHLVDRLCPRRLRTQCGDAESQQQ
jgi:hypothetical protein